MVDMNVTGAQLEQIKVQSQKSDTGSSSGTSSDSTYFVVDTGSGDTVSVGTGSTTIKTCSVCKDNAKKRKMVADANRRLENAKAWHELGGAASQSLGKIAGAITEAVLPFALDKMDKKAAKSSTATSALESKTEPEIPKTLQELKAEKTQLSDQNKSLLEVKEKLAEYNNFKTNTYEPQHAALEKRQGELKIDITNQEKLAKSLFSDDELDSLIEELKAKDENDPLIATYEGLKGKKKEAEDKLDELRQKEAGVCEQIEELENKNKEYLNDLAGANDKEIDAKIEENNERLEKIDAEIAAADEVENETSTDEKTEVEDSNEIDEEPKAEGDENSLSTSEKATLNEFFENIKDLGIAEQYDAIQSEIATRLASGASGSDPDIKVLVEYSKDYKNLLDKIVDENAVDIQKIDESGTQSHDRIESALKQLNDIDKRLTEIEDNNSEKYLAREEEYNDFINKEYNPAEKELAYLQEISNSTQYKEWFEQHNELSNFISQHPNQTPEDTKKFEELSNSLYGAGVNGIKFSDLARNLDNAKKNLSNLNQRKFNMEQGLQMIKQYGLSDDSEYRTLKKQKIALSISLQNDAKTYGRSVSNLK